MKRKFTYRPRIKNSVAQKILTKIVILGVLLNSIPINSLAGILSEDGRYETFIDNNITVNDVLEEDKVDVKIEGNTLVNIAPPLGTKNWTIVPQYNGEVKENSIVLNKVNGNPNSDVYTRNEYPIKNSTTYTVVFDIISNTDCDMIHINGFEGLLFTDRYLNVKGLSGRVAFVKTTVDSFVNINSHTKLQFYGCNSSKDNASIEISNLMILEGDYTNKPIPKYFEGIQSSFENNLITQEMIDKGEEKQENLGKYKVEVKSTGKNMFNAKADDFTNLEIIGNARKINFKLKPNTYYTLSSNVPDTNPAYVYFNGPSTDINSVDISHSKTILTDSTGEFYIAIRHTYYPDNFTITWEDFFNGTYYIQLEEGDVATEYEPYKESINTFYLNSPLLEGDTIEYINGKAYHVKRSKRVILDGSNDEKWNWDRNKTDTLAFVAPSLDAKGASGTSYANFKCDKLITECGYNVYNLEIEGLAINGRNEFNMSVFKSKLITPDLEGFKQWLTENPVTVIYELKEPIYEPIKADLSVQLFEGATHISNNSNIPANMEITVDRTINRATEAIELAKSNPTVDNLSRARMWINLLKETTLKDDLNNQIDNITEIEDLEIELKKATSNMDVYIKSQNGLSMSLSTNSIIFDEFDSTEDMEKLNAVNLTVNSSLPYRLNSYMMTELKNNDNTEVIPKELFNIRLNGETDYKAFTDINEKLVLKEDCQKGNNNQFNIDLILKGSLTHKADVYKTTIKFEAEQK